MTILPSSSTAKQRVQTLVQIAATESALLNRQAQLAAAIAGTPVCLVTLAESERAVVIGRSGWEIQQLPRTSSFVFPMIERGEAIVIRDAGADLEFLAHPLVTAGPRVKFVAVFPIRMQDGSIAGGIEVLDRNAKELHPVQRQSLENVAETVAFILSTREETTHLERELANAEEYRERLEESESRFREVFQNATDMIMSIAADGRILHANEAWYRALEYAEGEISQLKIHEIVHRDSREDFDESFYRVMQEGKTERVEAEFVSTSGNRITVEGSLVPKLMNGRPMLARVIFRDITERKRFELELSKARDAALESARLKAQFLTNVSHEIRTPMNGIVGMMELLLGTRLEQEQREFAQTALSSADSLLAIINNILRVSTLEAGRLSLAKVDFDLYRVASRIVDVMKVAAQEKKVEVSLEWDSDIATVLRGDPGALRQVVTNLMTNAVKFTDTGFVKLRVKRDRETATHDLIRIEVSDSGIGIPEDSRARLFEAFSQVDGSLTRRHSGVGLGLATAKQLVALMGGVIGVESSPGKGSTFWFNVPFEKSLQTSDSDPRVAFASMRILLVDQSDTHRRIVNHYLTNHWQMRTSWASSGPEALAMLRAAAKEGDPFRVALCDLHMPGMDGVTLAKTMQGDELIRDTATLLMTALGVQLDNELLRVSGVGGYLPKPVEQSELHDLIGTAIARDIHAMDPAALGKAGPMPAPAKPAAVLPRQVREKLKILVAEDNLLNQKVTLSQLRNLGFSAEAVTNGREVLDAFSQKSYSLILMDCQMPEMDGYEATMELRRREHSGDRTTIIAMTAHALDGDREKCLAAGMDDYLSKPTRQEDLEQMLTRWFGSAG